MSPLAVHPAIVLLSETIKHGLIGRLSLRNLRPVEAMLFKRIENLPSFQNFKVLKCPDKSCSTSTVNDTHKNFEQRHSHLMKITPILFLLSTDRKTSVLT